MDGTIITVIVVIVVIGLWVLISYFEKRPDRKQEPPAASANNEGLLYVKLPSKAFFSKIAGISRSQRALKRCSPGDSIVLEREPHNPYDENAIKILTQGGEHLGYVPRDTAEELAADMDNGFLVTAEISEITGGTTDKPTRGCNIKVTVNQGS